MSKKEAIWREILVQARQNKKTIFTQKELAEQLGVSLSTVFNALKIPRDAHIIEVSGRNFRLDSHKKLLLLFASHRNLARDIYYRAYIEEGPKELEAVMPPQTSFGLYSAFAFAYGFTPADYDHVYVYASPDMAQEIINRLPSHNKKDNNPNFFMLKEDPWLKKYGMMPEQMFVDIWNAPEWYAKDFLKHLEEKLAVSYE